MSTDWGQAVAAEPEKMPFKSELFRGMKGPEVGELQMWLDEMNQEYKYLTKFLKIETLKRTNYFGDDTARFVSCFQRFCDLPQTGVYDAKTHQMMEIKYWNYMRNMTAKFCRDNPQRCSEWASQNCRENPGKCH